jgi:hypothetical protein
VSRGALRFIPRCVPHDGTFTTARTPRAWLAWECFDGGPDPLPKWVRLCEAAEDRFRGDLLGLRLFAVPLQGACFREWAQ